MKNIITILMISFLGGCLAGCINSGTNPDQDNYYSEIILSDIFQGETKHILGLFSQSVREKIGESVLTEMIAEGSSVVQGNLRSYTVAEQAATGTRGGNGPNYNAYEIIVYTDLDIYEIELLRCEGDSTRGKETYKKSLGLEYIRIMPVGAKYLPDGSINSDLINSLDIGDGVAFSYKDAAKHSTYPEGSYTGYSLSVIQMNTETDFLIGANKEYAEELLAALFAEGLEGDISDIKGIYAGNTEYAEEISEGYNYHIVAENGTEFFAEFDPNAENGEHIVKVRKQ